MTDTLARTDAPVRALFERIAGPAAAALPDLTAIGAALVDLARDVEYLAPWVARIGGQSGAQWVPKMSNWPDGPRRLSPWAAEDC